MGGYLFGRVRTATRKFAKENQAILNSLKNPTGSLWPRKSLWNYACCP